MEKNCIDRRSPRHSDSTMKFMCDKCGGESYFPIAVVSIWDGEKTIKKRFGSMKCFYKWLCVQ